MLVLSGGAIHSLDNSRHHLLAHFLVRSLGLPGLPPNHSPGGVGSAQCGNVRGAEPRRHDRGHGHALSRKKKKKTIKKEKQEEKT